MNKFAKTLILGLAVYLTLVPSVAAAPLEGDEETVLSQRIRAGALTIQAPSDVVMDPITVSSEVVPTSGEVLDFKVDDARGTKTPAGWTATVTMSRFTDWADDTLTIPFFDSVKGENVYSLNPSLVTALNGANEEEVELGEPQELIDSDGDGVSDSVAIMSAGIGGGAGRFEADMEIHINVPANTVASTLDPDDPDKGYLSTMTFTVS